MELNRSQLEEWLKSKSNKIVGQAGTSCDCPLATWIWEITDERVEVAGTCAFNLTGFTPLPKWAQDFYCKIDYRYGKAYVTGLEALEVLHEVCIC